MTDFSEMVTAAYSEVSNGFPSEFLEKEKGGLESWAFALATFREAKSRIEKEGLVVADPKGKPVAHPALSIQRSASSDVEKWQKIYRRIKRKSD
jgi:Phage terminase, small subunit